MYFEDYGFDFIKVDWCGGLRVGLDEQEQYTKIATIIDDIRKRTGRCIVYNICRWLFLGEWAFDVADSWRTGADITPNFESVINQIDNIKPLAKFCSPGDVNDLDMMQLGNGMSIEEEKTHFAMWCMMSTPLMIGCDLTKISDVTLEILKNEELIAINQDKACRQAYVISELRDEAGNLLGEIWVKELEDNSEKAIAFLNRSSKPISMQLMLKDAGLCGEIMNIRNLCDHCNEEITANIEKIVNPHGTIVFKVKSESAVPAVNINAEFEHKKPKDIGNAVENKNISKSTLILQEGEIISEHERIKPVKIFTTPKGERVIDFGQNIAGYVFIELTANKGEKILISHAEILDSDGNFYNENYRTAKAKLEYICRDGHQTYKPFFTFYGFRYIRIDEYPNKINLDDFTAIAVYSDMKRTGYIETGNAKINKLYANTLWSQRSNFIDIPTDCPQRDECMGWLGDAQVFAKAASYNYDVKMFFKKWMGDVCSMQRADGSIPETVPNFWLMNRSSAAWGDAITIIPWQMYLFYGDDEILKRCFEPMTKWIDYITNDTLEEYLWICAESEKNYGVSITVIG